MTCYASSRLVEDVAFLAFHLHWSYAQIMRMDHGERRQWVGEAARLCAAAETRDGGQAPWR
jgi:hypothetical protein